MTNKNEIIQFMREHFHDHEIRENGKLILKKRRYRGRREIGEDASGYKDDGYAQITIFAECIGVHRLIWLYVKGEWPDHIDHINHDRSDNRIGNMRSVTHRQNAMNMVRSVGVCKVTSNKTHCFEGNNYWRGCVIDKQKTFPFTDEGKLKAFAWVKAERKRQGFHENHGKAVAG